MEDDKKKKIEEKLDLERQLEIQKMLMKADETQGEQLAIDDSGELKTEKEIRDFALGDVDNPEAKYEIYYHGIQKLLRQNLPLGNSNENARRVVYDEKNLLINRGKQKNLQGVRGSDGRMAYINDLEMALKIITDWILNKGTTFDLYIAFRQKNEELGYYSEEENG